MRLQNETTYPTHLFAIHFSKNLNVMILRKGGENIVTNQLQNSLVFNQRRLLRKRNMARIPDGRFG